MSDHVRHERHSREHDSWNHTLESSFDEPCSDSVTRPEHDDCSYTESSQCTEDDARGSGIYARPIVVGYAFGPKKMSTMGVVMAEASKAKLSAVTAWNDGPGTTDASSLTRARLTTHEGASERCSNGPHYVFTMDQAQGDLRHIVQHFRSSCSSAGEANSSYQDDASVSSKGETSRATLRTTASTTPSSVAAATGAFTTAPRRHGSVDTLLCSSPLKSSCAVSSVASSGGTQRQHPRSPCRHGSNPSTASIPIRVSFVPLDPDMPLEEQHGGKMDVILHKLTEDILCLSQMTNATDTSAATRQTEHQTAAIQRVQRLVTFAREHPECSLVDNPLAVRTVMSRAEIAVTLQACLQDCRTVSGCSVGSPAYAVLWDQSSHGSDVDDSTLAHVQQQVQNLSFPMIVKPLTAAGTKASHAMAIVLDPTALTRLRRVPCLCQEYSNHDAVLYKVYVLGHHVSVHKRRSLPNLPLANQPCHHPTNGTERRTPKNYMEFDSQRPYPRLEDFGFDAVDLTNGDQDSIHPFASKVQSKQESTAAPSAASSVLVTSAEVQPIVDALKRAFGLELFGFDILVTSATLNREQRMLVVDVNYFPSYKEVANFPALLAKYLTDLAMASRQRKINDTMHRGSCRNAEIGTR